MATTSGHMDSYSTTASLVLSRQAGIIGVHDPYDSTTPPTQSRKIFAAWFCQRPVMSAFVALSGAVCPAGSLRRWLLRFGCWTHDTLSHNPRSFLSLGAADITLGAQN